MFDPTSRYYAIETATYVDATGREIVYKRRRFVPQPGALTPLAEITVAEGDRLDNVTARVYGEPTIFWYLCDANNALHPDELTAEPGRRLVVPVPQGGST